MTDEARAAANAYQRQRRREIRETMTDEAKESKREYSRDWRQKNREKVREYNARYWAKKAALKASKIDKDGADTADYLYFASEVIADLGDLTDYLAQTKLTRADKSRLKRELAIIQKYMDTIQKFV